MFTTNKILNKEYKNSMTKIIIGAILCVLSVLMLILGTVNFMNLKKNYVHLNDVIIRDKEKTGQIAYVDVEGYMQFASYGDDLGYYIVWDEDYFYIASIKEKDYEYFAKKFDETDSFYRFWGYTEEIPSEAKSYAISTLNDEMGETYVTYSNFYDIFGDVCLRVEKEGKVKGIGGLFEASGTYLGGMALFGLFGLILLLTGLHDRKSFDVLKDSSGLGNNMILSQINSPTAKWYDKLRICLTDDYLVSVRNGVYAVRYSDIFWAHIVRHTTNGIPDYNYLNIYTNDGGRIVCGNGKSLGKKNREATSNDHEEILEVIHEKNENALMGYDQANQQAFFELKKKNK